MIQDLTLTTDLAVKILWPERHTFDAIVCAGDMHGVAIAANIANALDMPLMIVCTEHHDCVVSHIVTIGDAKPTMRYLYVDDWFSFGASMHHTMKYMNQSEHAPIVATYKAATNEFALISDTLVNQ